jgi:hypothetical protein
MLGPVVDTHEPYVTYSIEDSETVKRNFGRRIAFNYIVVSLQIHNPTDQTIQLNKSSVWFDCDYVSIANKDLYSNNPATTGHNFLFGIDQEQQQHAITLQQVVASFDAQSGLEKSIFDGADLSGAILAGLIGFYNNTEYSVAVNLFTGVLLPGIRNIVTQPDEITKKRTLLLGLSLDSIVQAGPKSSAKTLVFLPKKGILDWQDTRGIEPEGSSSSSSSKAAVAATVAVRGHQAASRLRL